MTRKLRRLLWPGVMAGGDGGGVARSRHLAGAAAGVEAGAAGGNRPRGGRRARRRLAPAQPPPFAKVAVTGRLRADLAALYGSDVRDTPEGPVLGAFLIEPLIRAGGPPVLVERGWVPETRRPAARRTRRTT